MPYEYRREMELLHPGDHLCLVYEDYEDQVAALVMYIVSGLNRNEQVLCIQHPHTIKHLAGALAERGVDVSHALKHEKIIFKTMKEAYVPDGIFDRSRMKQGIQEQIEAARSRGFSGFRATGDLGWSRKKCPGAEDLVEYEKEMDEVFSEMRAIGMCQYSRKRFPHQELCELTAAHHLHFQRDDMAPQNCHIRIRRQDIFADVVPDKDAGSALYHYIVQQNGSQKVLGWGQSPDLRSARAEAEFLLSQYAEADSARHSAAIGRRA